jgi:hypothetical protein
LPTDSANIFRFITTRFLTSTINTFNYGEHHE